jgi:N-methylhydantoinase B
MELVVEVDGPARANTAGDGVRHGACGLFGGDDGLPHRYVLRSRGRPDRVLRTKEVGIPIHPGDIIHVESGGGGGWGDPRARDPEARQRDVENGFVTGGGKPSSPTSRRTHAAKKRRSSSVLRATTREPRGGMG